MGSPKHQRKKYKTPSHPWQGARIEEEGKFLKEYGLKNKKEIWKMDSQLRRFKQQAKSLIARTGEQAKREETQLIQKLTKLGLIKGEAKMEDILGLTTKDIFDRRLQTHVFSRGLAKSMKQARQFISHGHIFIGGRKLTVPSYLIQVDEEDKIKFDDRSSLANPEHPERLIKPSKKVDVKTQTEIKKKETKPERRKETKKTKSAKKTKGEKVDAKKK